MQNGYATAVRSLFWRLLGVWCMLPVLAACVAVPSVQTQGAEPGSSASGRVVVAPEVEGIRILEVRQSLAPDGTLMVQWSAVSSAEWRQVLRYRAIWLDAQGLEMRTHLSNWNRRVIEPSQSFEALLVAPGPAAQRFRIEVAKSPP